MKHTKRLVLVVGGLAVLAGCGYSQPNRTAGGAGVGAGTGAAIGAIAGPPGAAVGALVGAVGGAVGGAATTPQQVNLGNPVWQHNMHVGSAQYTPPPAPPSYPPPPPPSYPPPPTTE
jgi:hypothetical protein